MKNIRLVSLALAGCSLLLFASASQAQSTNMYWDTDGTNPGLGVGGPYDWTINNLWNADQTGGGAGISGWTNYDSAYFNGAGDTIVTVSTLVTNNYLYVGNGISQPMTLDLILNTNLFTTNYVFLGASSTNSEAVNVNVSGGHTLDSGFRCQSIVLYRASRMPDDIDHLWLKHSRRPM